MLAVDAVQRGSKRTTSPLCKAVLDLFPLSWVGFEAPAIIFVASAGTGHCGLEDSLAIMDCGGLSATLKDAIA